MLVIHSLQSSVQERSVLHKSSGLTMGIEGSVKLAQSIMFPKQNGRHSRRALPTWYTFLRDRAEPDKSMQVTELASIRSVSTLAHVFGLSTGTTENIVEADVSKDGDDYTHGLFI